MKKHDDYVSGPHSYWIHFWCGLFFGAGIGAWIGRGFFDGGWRVVATSIVLALMVACSCGRRGDRAWFWIIENMDWNW